MTTLIGHKQLFDHFTYLHAQERLGQSYLFCGPEKIGKRAVVFQFIQSYFCEGVASDSLFATTESTAKKPCNSCHSCSMLEQQMYPDFVLIEKPEDKQSISVESIRDGIQKAYRSPTMGKRKFLLIDQAHLMTKAASNALLKTLEEPPASCLIFVITEYPDRLPQTIISRCEYFELSTLAQNEEVEALDNWKRARFLPGVYTELQSKPEAKEFLETEIAFFLKFLHGGHGERIALIEQAFKGKKETPAERKRFWHQRCTYWKVFFRDLLMLKLEQEDLLFYHELTMANSSKYSFVQLVQLQDHLSQLLRSIDSSFNLRLQLESFALQLD